MKIAIIAPFLPYSAVTHAGGYHIFRLITYLSKKNEIHLIVRVNEDELLHIDEMKRLCKSVHMLQFRNPRNRNIFSIFKIVISYLRLQILANRVQCKEQFDIVQIEHIEMGILVKKRYCCPFFIDAIDVISKPAKRMFDVSESIFQKVCYFVIWKLKYWIECFVVNKADHVITHSKQDMNILLNRNSSSSISAASFPARSSLFSIDHELPGRDKNVLLFVGAMNREFNNRAVLFFIRDVLPKLREKLPELKFFIVGANPSEQLLKIEDHNESVIVTGYAKDLVPFYEKAYIFVSPVLIGGGIITKNVDAMAAGMPVVTTHYGNEGIGARDGKEICEANSPHEFVTTIFKLLDDEKLYLRVARNGRRFAEDNFAEEKVMGKIKEIILKYGKSKPNCYSFPHESNTRPVSG